MTDARLPGRHLLLVLLICVGWGGNFLTSAAAMRELPPLLFTAARLSLVALLLLPWLRPPPSRQWRRLIAIGLCNGGLHFGLSFWSLKLAGDLASPAIVMQCYVPMASLLAVIVLGERLGWRALLGIAISFSGVLVLGFAPLVLDSPLSLILMLLAALALAVGTVAMRGMRDLHPLSFQAWSASMSVPALLLASLLIEGDPRVPLQATGLIGWGGVVYSALIASVMGHSLYFWLVQRHPVSVVMPYLLISPLVAITLGVLVWGDHLGPRLLIGGAMVLGGVLAVALRAKLRGRSLPEPSEA